MARILGIGSIVAVFSIACYFLISGLLTTERMGEYKALEEPQVEQYKEQVNTMKDSKKRDEQEVMFLTSEMRAFKATAKLQSTVDNIDTLLDELEQVKSKKGDSK